MIEAVSNANTLYYKYFDGHILVLIPHFFSLSHFSRSFFHSLSHSSIKSVSIYSVYWWWDTLNIFALLIIFFSLRPVVDEDCTIIRNKYGPLPFEILAFIWVWTLPSGIAEKTHSYNSLKARWISVFGNLLNFSFYIKNSLLSLKQVHNWYLLSAKLGSRDRKTVLCQSSI